MLRSCGDVRKENLTSLRATYRLVDQLFYPPCVPPRTIRDVKRSNVIRASFEHVIRAVLLQIALVRPLVTEISVELRSVANLPTFV